VKLLLKDNIPFVNIQLKHNKNEVQITDVLVDTGSGTTILSADMVQKVQISPSPNDKLYVIRGVGGNEVVFARKVDKILIGDCSIENFEVEIGGMDYGFNINGILGMDFLLQSGAIINLADVNMEFAKKVLP
jgi:predicted aspartyl protease